MSVFQPVNARSYYEALPASRHECGDIWNFLPSMGLFAGRELVRGIMVTPACDVSNFKTETLTYLPIISIGEYFTTIGHVPSVRRKIIERLNSANAKTEINWLEPGFELPHEIDLNSEYSRIDNLISGEKIKAKEKSHLERALAGIRIIRKCADSTDRNACLEDFNLLYGPEWPEIKKSIIRNSFKNDVHFLPNSGVENTEFGIESHSVAMFRYPISVPSEILIHSQNVTDISWGSFMQKYGKVSSAATHFKSARPVKILSLKAAYLSDLLSRFTSLYARIGSPDFSRATIDKYAEEIA